MKPRVLRRPTRLLVLPMLGLLLAAALLYTYLRAQDYDTAGYFEEVAVLRQVKQLDARWELDAMKSRIGLNQHYDPLVDPLRDMAVLPRQLLAPDRSKPLATAAAAYESALHDKAAQVEAFKSHNAVLRNSLAFLPTAAADIGQLAGTRSGLAALANRLLLAALMYHQVSGAGEQRGLETALATLQAAASRAPADLRERLDILALHAGAVLREQGTVDQLLGRMAAVPTAARIDAIANLLGAEQQRAVLQLQTYRRYLSLLATALVALLLYAGVRLMRSHATINRCNDELHDMNQHLEHRVLERTAELVRANALLQTEIGERKQLECLLVQSEKLASIGQLAAGVAHEINNPLAYLASNFTMLERYLDALFEMLAAYEAAEASVTSAPAAAHIGRTRERVELGYLKQEIPLLMHESRGGMDRVGKIVRDLKDFSHVDSEQDWQWADLRTGLASTFNIVASELRHAAEVETDYGAMQEIECLPSQLNQVFMNLMLNAAQAMGAARGRITIRTGNQADEVWVAISDTGSGIPADVLPRIFDPFFTTKGIGKGTGLGLSLSYGIVQQHHGRIEVETAAGVGTTFRVVLPVRRAAAALAA